MEKITLTKERFMSLFSLVNRQPMNRIEKACIDAKKEYLEMEFSKQAAKELPLKVRTVK